MEKGRFSDWKASLHVEWGLWPKSTSCGHSRLPVSLDQVALTPMAGSGPLLIPWECSSSRYPWVSPWLYSDPAWYHLPDRPPLNTTSAHMLHPHHSLSHDSTLLPPGPANTICSLVCACRTSPAQVHPGTEWMLEPHSLDRQVRGRTEGRECTGAPEGWRKLPLCHWVGSQVLWEAG